MSDAHCTKITIEHYGRSFTAELPLDSSMEDMVGALRGLLVAAGWNMDTVLEYMPDQDK